MKIEEKRDQILASRDIRRSEIQILKKAFKSVITVKANIPGEKKQLNISYILIKLFKKMIPLDMVQHFSYHDSYDGPYFLLGSNMDSRQLKTVLTTIENDEKLGRFIDLDVYDGEKTLSREKSRKCFLCEKDAFVCIREKNHTTEELLEYMNENVKQYLIEEVKTLIDESILLELNLHPKFGLVTPKSNGSHEDMNYDLMIKAKDAIEPFLIDMFVVGYSDRDLAEIFSDIRKIGLKAETAMMIATGNINAYKGLIFIMGIYITAFANSLYNNTGFHHVREIISQMSQSVKEDYVKLNNSFGLEAYERYGILGVRGEVLNGMPNVYGSLEYLKDFSEESRLHTLMYLVSRTEDTVLLKRAGSIEEYRKVKYMFKQALENNRFSISDLDKYCLENNLSFGGSADCLIVAIFIKKIHDFIEG